MNSNSPLILLLSLFVSNVSAQRATIPQGSTQLKFTVYQEDQVTALAEEIVIAIKDALTGELIATRNPADDGQFELTLSSYDLPEKLKFKLERPENLEFLDPHDGVLTLVRSGNHHYRLELTSQVKRNVMDQFLILVNKMLLEQQNWVDLQNDELASDVSRILQQNSLLLDSVYASGIKEKELQLLLEQERNKFRTSLVVPEFISLYNIYISRAQDLRDTFDQYGEHVFYRHNIVELLNAKVAAYNDAYELIITTKSDILVNVGLYWDDDDERAVTEFIERTTLRAFHRDLILQRNVDIMKAINAYNTRLRGRQSKKQIREKIELFVARLNAEIPELARESVKIADRLSS